MALGLSQADLSELVRARGLPTLYQQRIADIERGSREPRASELVGLARVLRVPITWLLGVPDQD